METLELRKNILGTMAQISYDMRDVILNQYFDKASKDEKYLLGMFEDANYTSFMICESIKEVALTQAGALLRKLIEQAAIVTILTSKKDLLPKYVEHYKVRKDIWNKTKSEQITYLSQRFEINEDPRALKYMDYGWLKKNAKEVDLYYEAGFTDLISWKDTFLDKFVHSSFINMDLVGDDYSFPIIHNLVDIMLKVFDYLCISFHNLTNFDFKFDDKDMFMGEFRKLYQEFINQNKE